MKNRSLTLSFILSLITFFLVTYVFTVENGYTYDQMIADKLSSLSSKSLLLSMEIISLLGSSEVILIITVLLGLFLLFRKKWYSFFLFFFLSLGGVALNFALKMLFQRERPGEEATMIEVFNYTLEIPSYSFPSGHTMRVTVLLLFILYLASEYLLESGFRTLLFTLITLLIIAVAASRLFLEAHYLSDTVAAISISISWFAFIVFIFQKMRGRNHPAYHRTIGK